MRKWTESRDGDWIHEKAVYDDGDDDDKRIELFQTPYTIKSHLSVDSLSLSNLRCETGFDGCDGSSTTTGIAGHEIQSVFSFGKFGVR